MLIVVVKLPLSMLTFYLTKGCEFYIYRETYFGILYLLWIVTVFVEDCYGLVEIILESIVGFDIFNILIMFWPVMF